MTFGGCGKVVCLYHGNPFILVIMVQTKEAGKKAKKADASSMTSGWAAGSAHDDWLGKRLEKAEAKGMTSGRLGGVRQTVL